MNKGFTRTIVHLSEDSLPIPPGTGSNYVHTQAIPSATWTVAHNLGYYPSVTVVDSSKREVEGQVEYIDINNVIITFAAAFSGSAYFS